jgi:hypothetical protein
MSKDLSEISFDATGLSEISFGARGETIVAFETTSTDDPVNVYFGVSVVGKTCGVYGQGTSGSQKDRRTTPFGTGVFGRGESYGVYALAGDSVREVEVPELRVAGPIAVAGVNISDSPALLGDNGILKGEIDTQPAFKSAINEGTQLPVGVEGISTDGQGVFGISLNMLSSAAADPGVVGVWETATGSITDPIDPTDPTRTVDAEKSPAGVLGLSVQGAGVRGVSRADRGGIFQSATMRSAADQPAVAQIRLVPLRVVLDRDSNPVLPKHGQTGDLLAVVYPDPNLPNEGANLWFCQNGESSAGGTTTAAVWRKVSLADSLPGSGP